MTKAYLTQTGRVIQLANIIANGKGGEGVVYEISSSPELVAKIYHPHILQQRHQELEKKLPLMVALSDNLLLNNTAWPQDVLYDIKTKQLSGFVDEKD